MSPAQDTTISACRSCGGSQLVVFLDLGDSPIADGLVESPPPPGPDPRFPLRLSFCDDCALVQLLDTLPPATLFCRDYPYFSSVSESWLRHSRLHALNLIAVKRLHPGSLVVEVASNDGYLLRYFADRGIRVLGIDPAEGPAQAARELGIETIGDFFGQDLAQDLRAAGNEADLIIANNVLAHVRDPLDFVRGLKTLIRPDGLLSIEFPYVRDLIEQGEYDTIYHQHLCYFSLIAVARLLATAGFHVNEVIRLPTHGGSLRIYAGLQETRNASVRALMEEEHRIGLDRLGFYSKFGDFVKTHSARLSDLLWDLKSKGHSIAGYGAAAKACTLLNYCGIDAGTLSYLADRNPHKHGKLMPGVRLPIVPAERLAEDQPDFALLLSWNLREEILHQQSDYRDRGGKFILPLPELSIV